MQLQFVGANVAPELVSSDRLPGTLNMLRGGRPALSERARQAWQERGSLQMALTVLVPYCISTVSSVSVLRELRQAPPPDAPTQDQCGE